MRSFRPVSYAEQVAEHLRKEIVQGTLGTKAPGVHRLAAELGVHHTTAEEALQLLEKEGLLASQGPGRRRLICADPDPTFEWYSHSIAHISWDSRLVARRVAQWANNVARGNDDRRQSLIKAELVKGGTIGPVPAAR